MNSIEAMLLDPQEARNYLTEIDLIMFSGYGDLIPMDLGPIVVTLREGVDDADQGLIDVNEVLGDVIEMLDELDQDDYFGTQGWRYLMGEV